MMYAVELLFDKPGNDEIQFILDELKERDLLFLPENNESHITLSLFKKANPSVVSAGLEKFAATQSPVKIHIASIGMFLSTGVIYLNPSFSGDLNNLHEDFYRDFSESMDSQGRNYLPGKWAPHISLGLDIPFDLVLDVLEVLEDNFTSSTLTLNRVALVEFFPIKKICEFSLNKNL